MRELDIRRLLERQPCPRMRLHLTNGLIFEIHDPDLVVLNRSVMELEFSSDQTREREAVISLLHIIWIEVLPPVS